MAEVNFRKFEATINTLESLDSHSSLLPSVREAFVAGYHLARVTGKSPDELAAQIEETSQKIAEGCRAVEGFHTVQESFVLQLAGLCGMLSCPQVVVRTLPRIQKAMAVLSEQYWKNADFKPESARKICINLVEQVEDTMLRPATYVSVPPRREPVPAS